MALLAAAALAWVGPARPAQAKPPGAAAAQAYRAGLTAYTHAYPAIMHRLSQRTFPVNALVSIDALSTPADRLVVLPNVDTVYSVGKLDLRAGPLVVHVPAMDDRYFVLQLMDAYTDVVGYVGSRTTGPGPRDTIIVGPHDRTPLPAGMPVLRSPTDDALLLGRTLVRSPGELPALRSVLAGYALGPLGAEQKPSLVLDQRPRIPRPTPPAGLAFFDLFDEILAEDPPSAAEAKALSPLARYGIGPGLSASRASLAPTVRAALERAVRDGYDHLQHAVDQRRAREQATGHGWSTLDPRTGGPGTDYQLRAITAVVGLWANTPDEAMYVLATDDAAGRPLDGRHRYALTFTSPPPARAFWSLTMYDDDLALVDNPIDRYAIGDRTAGLRHGTGGAVSIRLQHGRPSGSASNWLPTPRGRFTVSLRLYVPRRAALTGRWRPPGIRCLDCR